MDSKVDKLFKEKLDGDVLTPSPDAWKKVEAHLSKKNRVAAAIRIAAALALFSLITYAIIQSSRTAEGPDLADSAPPPADTQAAPVNEDHETSKAVPKQSYRTKLPAATAPQNDQRALLEESPVIEDDSVTAELNIDQETFPLTESGPEEKPIVLVYSLPPLVRKNPDKIEDERRTGIQKVIDVAIEVKNSDNALGELREAKNDLFALEFKRDKKEKKQ